ncbi:hypothetical protein BLA39750_01206 [Burkholderia lata]|uniref:Uncharacterized protein n=1 Tax=Burkholderia lata (strain ATCC 17760 / DSM 23089 / LMG 22485 / NCIMB 9086 / R18194 / 383) TaxID=482957 RepID=A0A6P2V4T6_BURL3|nr:hypothetical protein [Burkholderia lata]VWC81124.1 hypothetical protein BLA39750_01206 [Burkholderia lata]
MNSKDYSPTNGAEFVSLKQFTAEAAIVPLVSHGRKAYVLFRGQSIGFVDMLGEDGLRQVHRSAVNNALYCNEEEDVPHWLHRPLPSTTAVSDYPEMEGLFPRAYARVMKPAQGVLEL